MSESWNSKKIIRLRSPATLTQLALQSIYQTDQELRARDWWRCGNKIAALNIRLCAQYSLVLSRRQSIAEDTTTIKALAVAGVKSRKLFIPKYPN